MSLLSFLEKQGLITADHIASLTEARTSGGERSLAESLKKLGIDETQLLEAKSSYYRVPLKPVPEEIDQSVLERISSKAAERYKILPLDMEGGALSIGMVDPEDTEARDTVQFAVSKEQIPYKIFLISESGFERGIKGYEGLSGQVSDVLSQIDTSLTEGDEDEKKKEEAAKKAAAEIGESIESVNEADIVEEAPVTKIVATIIRYAVEGKASDIHIENMEKQTRVRFRVDGTLYTSLVLPVATHNSIVARIKILSKLRLDEKRKPQDGRFSAHIDGRKIDFRVSTFPAYYGEKVVMRILDSEKGVPPLDSIGLSDDNMALIKEAINRPYGLILVTGPTGSGKTTSLYSMLNEIDRDSENVLSLEDPVEYNVPGISQSQVRPDIGYTFATGLRTTLRQDPDVIFVGEIRDKETAQLAIQAALTGHLVFSTIHTNTAIGAIPRLVDMGVDPYLIAPTLVLAIGQRLTKKLCEGAGRPVAVEDSVRVMVEKELEDVAEPYRSEIVIPPEVYEAASTKDCPSGTKGRTAVFEVFKVTKEVERMILEDPTEQAIMEIARRDGFLTMREDALMKAFNGAIPFEEVNKL